MPNILGIIGVLIFLFAACYFFAALGNHGKYVQRPENNLGCAVILFVPILLIMLLKALFG